jgi:hypothetical protein
MKVRPAILKPKYVTEKGEWKLVTGTSKMPRSAFTVGANYPVTFSRNWHWRVDQLACDDGEKYRLLTAYNAHIEEFRAWLAIAFEKGAVLLARYEYHGTHPGWHCHGPCGDLEQGDAGALSTRDVLRVPEGKGFHRDQDFDITSVSRALARSHSFFRVKALEGDLL